MIRRKRGALVRVLIIEDNKTMIRYLRQGLEEEGFAVDVAADGEEGDYKARSLHYDAIVLDLMLPKIDGLTLLQNWRRAGINTHVLVLTARGEESDKVNYVPSLRKEGGGGFTHFQARSHDRTGRARMGSPRRKRWRSSASSRALP